MNIYKTILKPIVTEKTSVLQADRKYTFAVSPRADKLDVKKAIEEIYKVNVVKIAIVNTSEKTRMGKTRKPVVKKKSYKKAIITIKNGQTLDYHNIK